jgi:CheY-like chemotaxis protein
MTRILIADASKPSLVMSSEAFKDKIPGCNVSIAYTGEQALQRIAEETFDLLLIDFDLPDVDGPSLIKEIRDIYRGPILLSAFPDPIVVEAVRNDLFIYADASAWIKKPVRFDDLSQKIDTFLIQKNRTNKRFDLNLEARVVVKSEGRGKRTPKAEASILNISMGGALLKIDKKMKMKKKQELTISLDVPSEIAFMMASTRAKTEQAKSKTTETRIRGIVAWARQDGQIGLHFDSLTDNQKKGLEVYLRSCYTS